MIYKFTKGRVEEGIFDHYIVILGLVLWVDLLILFRVNFREKRTKKEGYTTHTHTHQDR